MTSSAKDEIPIARFSRGGARRAKPQWTVRLERGLSREIVGGKARGLGLLMEAGFRVPPSFCVTTDVFHSLLDELAPQAENLDHLRQLIRETALPEYLVDEIAAQMEYIGATRWAVRSSAVDEDGSERSFAGLGKTVLDVSGLEQILEAIREVWASHFQLENLLYRARDEVQASQPPMAVIVQEMLDPQVAGVLFTENPLTGDVDEVVVSSARGLGEAVVAGKSGETHYLDKSSGYVRRHVAENRKGLLSDDQLRELTTAARGVESAMGKGRDIEWAYAFGRDQPHRAELYLLQSRPITTDTTEAPVESVWTNTNVGEALPGVATPMTWSIIFDFSRRGFEQAFGTLGLAVPEGSDLVRSFRGRIYLNLTQFMSIASGLPLFKPERLFSMAGGGGVDLVKDIYEKRSKTGFFKRLPITIPRVLVAQLSMPIIAPLWGKYFTGKVEEFFDFDLEGIEQKDLNEELEMLDSLFDRTGLVMLSTSSNFLMSYVVTAELLRLLGGEKAARREQELFSGLDVKSAEPGLALLELGRMVRRSLRLRRIITETEGEETVEALWNAGEHEDVANFLAALDAFRKQYGHRAPREAELATPRWREDMSFLFEVMSSFVEAPHLPSSIEVQRERNRTRESAREFLEQAIPGGLDVIFKCILAFTRSNARRREYMRDRVVDALDIYRHFFLECGRRLTEEGLFQRPEDVFFITRDEIEEWLQHTGPSRESPASDFALRVLTRRALYDHYRNQPDPPDTFLLRGDQIVPEVHEPMRFDRHKEDGSSYLELRGLPGSPGRVTGPARVILDPHTDDATIRPGEILVAPYTDVGWTPLFLAASGVVMSLGGPLSHSCIVAREYGIPTVVNAKRATEVLKTGDWITVDGDRGVVYLRQDGIDDRDR